MKSLIISKFNSLAHNDFVRNVSILAGATAIAQALSLIASPLLTRLYSPSEFGTLGVYTAFLTIIVAVASLRYELAIPLPKSAVTAASLVGVCLLVVVTTSLVTAGFILLFHTPLSGIAYMSGLLPYIWLLPVGVFFGGTYTVFFYWATRQKEFVRISQTRVQQSVGGTTVQLLLGAGNFGAIGLIAGQIISQGAGSIGLMRGILSSDYSCFKKVSFRRMKASALRFRRFPQYSAIESLANSSNIQIPLLLIASLAGGHEVGFLLLAMRTMQAPLGVLGSSFSQVYFRRAVDEEREKTLGAFTAKTIGGLIRVGVGPLLFVGLVAPHVFGTIFGESWQRSGDLIAWMTPWFVFQFLCVPISMALHVTSKQRVAMSLQIFGLIFRVSFVTAIWITSRNYVAEAYAVSGFLFYLLYLLVIIKVSKANWSYLFSASLKAFPIVIAWVLAGCSVCLLLRMNH